MLVLDPPQFFSQRGGVVAFEQVAIDAPNIRLVLAGRGLVPFGPLVDADRIPQRIELSRKGFAVFGTLLGSGIRKSSWMPVSGTSTTLRRPTACEPSAPR